MLLSALQCSCSCSHSQSGVVLVALQPPASVQPTTELLDPQLTFAPRAPGLEKPHVRAAEALPLWPEDRAGFAPTVP